MDLERLASLHQYVDLDDEVRATLVEFQGLARPHFEAVVDDFYAAIERHPRASNVITGGREQVERLKRTLVVWMESILGGRYDHDYLERHARTGRVHVRIGLPQELIVTAMSRIRNRLLRVAHDLAGHDIALCQRYVHAINLVLDLELAIMLDTYRESTDEKVRALERQAVAEAAPAFVLSLSADGAVKMWNRQLEEVTGLTPEQALGRRDYAAVRQGGDLPLRDHAGGQRVVRWRCSRPSADGTLVAVGVDVTDEKEMLRRTLRAERLAAVGTLAAGLAHEVRNPLNSASLQLQVLRRRIEKRSSESELLHVTSLVSDEVKRLELLVSDFLAFAQPRPLDLKPLRVGELLDSVAEQVRPEVLQAGVRLVKELDPDVHPVDAEPERLRQVLLNLTRNALEAMQGEGGALTLRARTDAEGWVCMEVEDSGPGFPADAPIFDAFFSTKPSGTGLGLAIVHRIVTEHGGNVVAESIPGRTRFTLRLPPRSG